MMEELYFELGIEIGVCKQLIDDVFIDFDDIDYKVPDDIIETIIDRLIELWTLYYFLEKLK